VAIFRYGIFMPPLVLGWIAAVLVALSILFAIWARINLGRNWSSAPAVKEKTHAGDERTVSIRTSPHLYRRLIRGVRHSIDRHRIRYLPFYYRLCLVFSTHKQGGENNA